MRVVCALFSVALELPRVTSACCNHDQPTAPDASETSTCYSNVKCMERSIRPALVLIFTLPCPPPSQLAGNYGTLFEGYFQQLDVTRNGRIDATSAAAFLKKSQLGDPVLHKVSRPDTS